MTIVDESPRHPNSRQAMPRQVPCGEASARIENRQLRILVKGEVPAFLLQANQAYLSGDRATALSLLGEENLELVRKALTGPAHRVDLMYMLAKLFADLREFDRAECWCRRIVEQEPSAVAYSQLAQLLSHSLVHMSEGLEWIQRAVALEPDNPVFLTQLGKTLFDVGRTEEGLNILEQTAKRFPDDLDLLAGLLWRMHYVPSIQREGFEAGYRQWGRGISRRTCMESKHKNNPDPSRRLRIGFISPDFCRNSAAYTFEPFLDGYDKRQLEVFAYANNMQSDATTERMKCGFDHFRSVFGIAPAQVAALVQQDEIDILVEIGGHVRGHCLEVMAYKPAPIQVDLGGIDTTGLRQVDCRITDTIFDPPHWCQPYVEKNIYLANGSSCYKPPGVLHHVGPLPARRNGHITFAAFHGRHKLNDHTLALWGRVLNQVANARLLLKLGLASDRGVVAYLFKQCERNHLDTDRIELLGWQAEDSHLALYNRVDMALDAYPFNGGVTTLEALWMGVPTVSLSGSTWVSRTGKSIMNRVGLDVFVASNVEEYVSKAVAFAGQLDELEQIRRGLREIMLSSPLCNAKRYADELTLAFRDLWENWCETGS